MVIIKSSRLILCWISYKNLRGKIHLCVTFIIIHKKRTCVIIHTTKEWSSEKGKIYMYVLGFCNIILLSSYTFSEKENYMEFLCKGKRQIFLSKSLYDFAKKLQCSKTIMFWSSQTRVTWKYKSGFFELWIHHIVIQKNTEKLTSLYIGYTVIISDIFKDLKKKISPTLDC